MIPYWVQSYKKMREVQKKSSFFFSLPSARNFATFVAMLRKVESKTKLIHLFFCRDDGFALALCAFRSKNFAILMTIYTFWRFLPNLPEKKFIRTTYKTIDIAEEAPMTTSAYV